MHEKFKLRVDKLPNQLQSLMNCNAVTRTNLASVPKRGVYLFLENEKPIYVGRTDRMRARLTEHGRKGAGNNDASFAFRLAKSEAKRMNLEITGKRKEIEIHPEFSKLFTVAKQRVAAMQIKYIEINDSVDQYLFEVYASEVLQTPFNDFENH